LSTALLLAIIVVLAGVRGRLDTRATALAVAAAVAYGTLDYLLNHRPPSPRATTVVSRRSPALRQAARSATNGVLVAVACIVAFAICGDLDGLTALAFFMMGALSGTLDYSRNRKQARATDQTRADSTPSGPSSK